MADEVKNGLSAYIASKWDRNTVADGSWLQKYTLNPLTARDYYLASAIDELGNANDSSLSALNASISSVSSIHDDYINYLSATISEDISGYIDSISGSLDDLSDDLQTSVNTLLQKIDDETGRAEAAETKINTRLNNMEAATDVINVYGSWDDFSSNSGDLFTVSGITDNDIIKILNDKNSYPNEMFTDAQTIESGHQTYFRWINSAIPASAHIKPLDPSSGYWDFIGYVDPYYTTTEIDEYLEQIDGDFDSVSAAISELINSASEIGNKLNTTDFNNWSGSTASLFSGTSRSATIAYKAQNVGNVDSADLISSAENGNLALMTLSGAKWSADATNMGDISAGFTLSAGAGVGFNKNHENHILTISAELTAFDTVITSISAGDTKFTGTNVNFSEGKNIKFSAESTDTLCIGIDTDNFSATNISSLNYYIPSSNKGAPFDTEINYDSTGISAHTTDRTGEKNISTDWTSIIDAANATNNYVPLSAEACIIGDNNNANDDSFSQGSTNSANNNSIAQGAGNSANSNSIAQGAGNIANNNSIAQGAYNSANKYSIAFGYKSIANDGGFAFSPNIWGNEKTMPSFASGNAFAFGNGCSANTNAFAMGYNCTAYNGGFAYGYECSAASNSIAIGVGMVSKEKQISLGYYGKYATADNSNIVFHVGYGKDKTNTNRGDILSITSGGTIISYDGGEKFKEEVKLDSIYFQSPKLGRRIPMCLSQGLGMSSAVNNNVNIYPSAFSARHNIIYGDNSSNYSFNMWIPSTTVSQEFTLTKASCVNGGVYRLTIGVHKDYTIMFKNFAPNIGTSAQVKIKTGLNTSGSWPSGGTTSLYSSYNFFLDNSNVSSNTYFNFPAIPCDDVITFIVDGKSKKFIMIKGHG